MQVRVLDKAYKATTTSRDAPAPACYLVTSSPTLDEACVRYIGTRRSPADARRSRLATRSSGPTSGRLSLFPFFSAATPLSACARLQVLARDSSPRERKKHASVAVRPANRRYLIPRHAAAITGQQNTCCTASAE